MKIGIITLPLNYNIGGILQAWALQTTLTKMGNDVKVIDRKSTVKSWIDGEKSSIVKKKKGVRKDRDGYTENTESTVKKSFLRKILHPIASVVRKLTWLMYDTINIIKIKYTNKFTYKEIHYSGSRCFETVRPNDFDAIVVGSDQIWRADFVCSTLYSTYLDFAKDWNNIKRFAYAISFGLDKWNYTQKETEVCAALAEKFDEITVREDSAVDLCRKHLNVKATHVLDPTMLITRNEYSRLIDEDKTTYAGSEIFGYVLDETPEIKRLIEHVGANSKYTKTHILAGTFSWRNVLKRNINQFPTVTQWLRCFRDSRCVITDSFHGTVFSIIFNKPFVVLHNAQRGNARMESLVRTFGLEDRLIDVNERDRAIELLQKPFDIEDRLLKLREMSLGIIEKHFKE